MEKLLVFIICVTLLSFSPAGKTEKTFYYYCFSRSGTIAQDGSSIKQNIMYNKISSMTTDDNAAPKRKAKQWGDWVDSRCMSRIRCSSDTNLYETEEEAEKAYSSFLITYADTSRYTLQLVEFR
jgi:hypothetical protein